MIIWKGGERSPLTVEFGGEVDPAEAERRRAQMERSRRNSAWLQALWADLLPQARGKCVAVAGEEGFIADKAEEARAWTRQVHPEDDGTAVQYVRTDDNPRIYECLPGSAGRHSCLPHILLQPLKMRTEGSGRPARGRGIADCAEG